MSWFARSIANTIRLDEDDDDERHREHDNTDVSVNKKHGLQVENENLSQLPGQGVKEDLSEITKTLTRQFWGIASFLAPEHSNVRSESSDPEAAAPEAIAGIRRDFAEIGGRFRTGISKLSNNIDVSDITKMASNFLQLDSEDEDYDSVKSDGAVGVTDEVVAFARDIVMHPETWLDFPLPEDEDDDEDFELSDAQQEHALAVERLAPRLAALRIELCPGYMSESYFWKIYFVLLHPRLERHAAELLSTPEIVKARASLTHELKNRSYAQTKPEGPKTDSSPSCTQSESAPLDISTIDLIIPTVSADQKTEKHPIQSYEIQIVDKSVIQEEPHNNTKTENLTEDDTDDWLKEESSEIVTGKTTTPIEDDQDVSFSDLEDDDDDDGGDVPISYKKPTYGSDSSTKDSRDWVQLGRSSADSAKDNEHSGSGQVSAHNSDSKESNDWLDVVDIDVA